MNRQRMQKRKQTKTAISSKPFIKMPRRQQRRTLTAKANKLLSNPTPEQLLPTRPTPSALAHKPLFTPSIPNSLPSTSKPHMLQSRSISMRSTHQMFQPMGGEVSRLLPKSSRSLFTSHTVPTRTPVTPLHSLARLFSSAGTEQPETLDITYIEPSGDVVPLRIKTKDHADDSIMTLAVKNQVDMEGSCDGQLACSTCHCILSQEDYDAFLKLKPATDEELDMLDTAFGLTPTSRLGCQIPINMLTKNITLTLPKFTR